MLIDGDALRAQYERAMDRAAARLAVLEALSSLEDEDDGAVLRIVRNFGGERDYTYVALRIGGAWYLSGQKHYIVDDAGLRRQEVGPGLSAHSLLRWLVESGGDISRLQVHRMRDDSQLV